MSFPAEFNFSDEADFIGRMLIPLLRRLGFEMIANYHGKREFGKDLVFGTIDQFGHVVYSGLQAKYVSSVGLAGAEDLVLDVAQAFANPFTNPHTGNEERISTFFSVNGGAISDEAKTHFFNSTRFRHGANVRLLAGIDLVALDRMATVRTGDLRAQALGVSHACDFNTRIATKIATVMLNYITLPERMFKWPAVRFHCFTFEHYLASPGLPHSNDELDVIAEISEKMSRVNKFLDAYFHLNMDGRLEIAKGAYDACQLVIPNLHKMLQRVEQFMKDFGPICAI